jgi:hypothetical protein
MKTRNFQKPRLTIIACTTLALVAGNALAQDSATSSTSSTDSTVRPAAASQPAPQLSYGVPEILQLSQAKVSDGTIINYIRSSGNSYGLNAAQIIYLRQQGVSDAVINAMLDQRSQTAQTASTASAATPQPASSNTSDAQASTVTVQPTVTYVQTVPSSSVYIIPDTQTYYYNTWFYCHSPRYSYSYPAAYCWPRSAVSVSFGWGGHWGGYHGGWHGGGGWHR